MKREHWKDYLALTIAGGLTVFGLGSSCPGTGSTANFTDPALVPLAPVAAPSHSWTPAMLIDFGAVYSTDPILTLDFNTNIVNSSGSALASKYPAAVFNDSSTDFFAIFNSANANPMTASADVFLFATQQVDMSSSGWVSGLGSFTQLDDVGTSVQSQHPVVNVDSSGNAMAVFIAQQPPSSPLPSQTRPMASLHTFGDGPAWTLPAELSDLTQLDAPGNALNSLAVSHDVFGDFIAVWVQPVNPTNNPSTSGVQAGSVQQGAQVWFNEYRPGLGWRFHTSPVAAPNDVPFVPWQDQTNVGAGAQQTVLDLGVDVGFDPFGNGYGLYVANAAPVAPQCPCPSPPCSPITTIFSARWRSDEPQNFPLTFNGGSGHGNYAVVSGCNNSAVFGYPRIWVGTDGSATAFWWQSLSSGTAQLWSSRAAATNTPQGPAGGWSVPVRLDTNYGFQNSLVVVGAPTVGANYSPIVAYDNSGSVGMGVYGFIKTDGKAQRLFVFLSTNNGASWSFLGNADIGGVGASVTWGSLAVNNQGQVVATYTALDPNDFREHIYANFYSNGTWNGVNDISHDCPPSANGNCTPLQSNIIPDPAENSAFPVASIDELGDACVVFSIRDNIFSPTSRRTAAAFFH